MSEGSSPQSEPPLHDYIDMEAYDVVPGDVHRRLVEQLEAEAQYRVKAEQAIARLEEAVRVCGRHLYDCCRSDINWKLQIETHDQAVNAVAWVECDEPYPQKAQR